MKKRAFFSSGSPTKKHLVLAAVLFFFLFTAGGGIYLTGGTFFSHEGHDHGLAVAGEKNGQKTLYTCSMHPWIIQEEPGDCPICGMKLVPTSAAAAEKTVPVPAAKDRKILYWKAPMDPTEIYDQPGKSKMGMDLVPVYEDQVSGGTDIAIDPVTQQNMGVRMTSVLKGDLGRVIRTYGHLTYDETRTAQINPKFSGWIEKLHVSFAGQTVKKNEPLFAIYSPELVMAQEEYLAAFRVTRASNDADLLTAARKRLGNMDVPEDEIRAIEKSGRVKRAVTIRSPFTGVVIKNQAMLGGFVKQGTTVFTIADLSRIWVDGHIYEYELPLVKKGQKAVMTLSYLPGKTFTGTVSFIYPYLQRQTRDVLIRLEFDNQDLSLKPEMYGDIRIYGLTGATGLVVPMEAVIHSGERNIVFVSRGGGKFSPRNVTLGAPLDEGMVHVLTGLSAGESVVSSGQFLLDSESRLKEAVRKMMEIKEQKTKDGTPGRGEQAAPAAVKKDDVFFDDMAKPVPSPETLPQEKKNNDFFKDM